MVNGGSQGGARIVSTTIIGSPLVAMIAGALCLMWAFLLISAFFNDSPVLAATSLVLLYGATLIALKRSAASASQLPLIVPVMSFPVVVMAIFTAWGLLTGWINQLSFFMDFPAWVRIGSIFLAGSLAATAIALPASALLMALYGRLHWLPVAVAAVAVFAMQWHGFAEADMRGLTRAVIGVEFFCLAIGVPAIMLMMRPVVRSLELPILERTSGTLNDAE